MSINAIPKDVFYDPQSWIDLAPDFNWDKLIPEPDPENGSETGEEPAP